MQREGSLQMGEPRAVNQGTPSSLYFCELLINRKWKMFDCPPYPWAGIASIQEIKMESGHKDKFRDPRAILES